MTKHRQLTRLDLLSLALELGSNVAHSGRAKNPVAIAVKRGQGDAEVRRLGRRTTAGLFGLEVNQRLGSNCGAHGGRCVLERIYVVGETIMGSYVSRALEDQHLEEMPLQAAADEAMMKRRNEIKAGRMLRKAETTAVAAKTYIAQWPRVARRRLIRAIVSSLETRTR